MAAPDPPSSPKGLDFATFSPFVAAIVAAAGAFALFEPKLERIRAMKNEVGHFEPGFLWLYVVPQWFLLLVSISIVLFLGMACANVIDPSLMSGLPLIAFLRTAFDIQYIAWTIVAVAILAIAIRWNWLSRILLLAVWGLSALPIAGLRNRFGPDGESIGWHQAKAVCEGPDKGAPLLIKKEDLDRVARVVLTRLSQHVAAGGGDKNYADEPAGLSPEVKANMLLFGCIMEVNFSINRWTKPDWKPFFASLADIQAATPMFAPSELLAFPSGNDFFAAFRKRLDEILISRGVARPPDQSLEAAGDIVRAWDLLKKKAKGNTLRLAPWFAPALGGKVWWLDRRMRTFPRMDNDGMRPQLIKLLIRWGCLPMSNGIFVQPFSRSMAWLLLHQGALTALPETKEVTFNIFGQAPISRLSMKRVLDRVTELISEGASAEATTVAATVGDSTWKRFEAGDFILWSWASEARREAAGAVPPWDKAKWKWKFDDDRIVRQS